MYGYRHGPIGRDFGNLQTGKAEFSIKSSFKRGRKQGKRDKMRGFSTKKRGIWGGNVEKTGSLHASKSSLHDITR